MATGAQTHDRESSKLVCDLCELKIETLLSKCLECDVYMCRICTKAHTKVKLTSDHKIIADQHGPLPTAESKSICTSHPGEDVSFYCYTCNILICSKCISGNHSNHKYLKIKVAAKKMEVELSQMLAKFKDTHISVVISNINKAEIFKADNETQGNLTVQNIKARTDELVSEINKIRDILIQESEKSKEENNKYLTQIHTSLTKELTEMETLYSDYSNVLISGSDIDKIIAKNQAATSMGKFKSRDQEVEIHAPKFIPGATDISSLKTSFGSIDKEEEMGSDFDHRVREQQSDKNTGNLAVSTNVDVKVISTFNHKSKLALSICPVTDTTALLHCYDEYKNDIVNTEGIVQRTVKMDFLVRDIIMTSDGIIASDLNSTNIYKLRMGVRKSVFANTAPLRPACLCMSSDGNILVTMVDTFSYHVTDNSRRLVARIETKTARTIESYEYDRGTRLFTLPTDIDENINGGICVVNSISTDSGHLVILENKGWLHVIYRGGQMDKQFNPTRVKCDKLGHIIVSDWNNMKIHLLSSDGQLVQYLMTDKELSHGPYSLSINKQGLLWVGCAKGKMYVIKYINK